MRLPQTKIGRAILVVIGYVILVMTYFFIPVTTMHGGIFTTLLVLLVIQPVMFGFVSFLSGGAIGAIALCVIMAIVEIFKWIFGGK